MYLGIELSDNDESLRNPRPLHPLPINSPFNPLSFED
jgi:hypothetical protein